MLNCRPHVGQRQPGIERVQGLADISRSALCCRSNETRAPIVNPPNSAQLEGTRYHSPKLHPGPCSSVGMRRGADTQTDTHSDTQTAVTTIHFASFTTHAKRYYSKHKQSYFHIKRGKASVRTYECTYGRLTAFNNGGRGQLSSE